MHVNGKQGWLPWVRWYIGRALVYIKSCPLLLQQLLLTILLLPATQQHNTNKKQTLTI